MKPVGLPKTGGRRKGTPNKKTLALQDMLEANGLNPVERLCILLPSLRPKEQADVLINLLGYIFPRRKAIEHTAQNDQPLTFAAWAKQLVDDEGMGSAGH